jgi:hypothetical protein
LRLFSFYYLSNIFKVRKLFVGSYLNFIISLSKVFLIDFLLLFEFFRSYILRKVRLKACLHNTTDVTPSSWNYFFFLDFEVKREKLIFFVCCWQMFDNQSHSWKVSFWTDANRYCFVLAFNTKKKKNLPVSFLDLLLFFTVWLFLLGLCTKFRSAVFSDVFYCNKQI